MSNRVKSMIATRANKAIGRTVFFKSYIKNVKKVDERNISYIWEGCETSVYEVDYTFDYKGKKYRVNEARTDSFLGYFTIEEIK